MKHYWCRVAYNQYDRPNLKEHCHSFFELHLCLTGECELDVQGNRMLLKANDFVLLAPQIRHTILRQSETFSKFVWGFSVRNDAVAGSLIQQCNSPAVAAAGEDILRAVEIILTNSAGHDLEYHNLIRGQLYYIFIQLVRLLTGLQTNQSYQKNLSTQMAEIRKYISDNLNLSATDISDEFFLSRKQLTRICMEECKMTVTQLKHSLQREKIRQMLTETDASLEEIAQETGFADKYSMSKFFHRQEGMPPAKYRKSVKA